MGITGGVPIHNNLLVNKRAMIRKVNTVLALKEYYVPEKVHKHDCRDEFSWSCRMYGIQWER